MPGQIIKNYRLFHLCLISPTLSLHEHVDGRNSTLFALQIYLFNVVLSWREFLSACTVQRRDCSIGGRLLIRLTGFDPRAAEGTYNPAFIHQSKKFLTRTKYCTNVIKRLRKLSGCRGWSEYIRV